MSTDDAAIIARHRYLDAGAKEDLVAYERWVATRIERGIYTGILAERDGGVIAGAGAVILDWGPTRGEPTGLRAHDGTAQCGEHQHGLGVGGAGRDRHGRHRVAKASLCLV